MPRPKKTFPPAKPAKSPSPRGRGVRGEGPKLSAPLASVKHKDSRVNIPTEELRDFVADDEKKPRTVLYPRDPSLDPQLVWKGKDEQDAKPLEVPAVPIYIQEKIQPQAIIENVRANLPAKQGSKGAGEQMGLFNDFNGIPFEDLIDFYHHEQHWSNRFILGDSLMVMTSLAEKEALKGKVQMMYFDPPYGIKFGSNWQVSTRKRDVKDGKAEDATRQPEQIKAFRDTWQLGIHSYLAYLRDRLTVARELLTESGSIFVQIGDENVHLVRSVLDEVFGSENFCALINFRSMSPLGQKGMARVYDYILWYSKSVEVMKFRPLYVERSILEEPEFAYIDDGGAYERIDTQAIKDLVPEQRSKVFKRSVLTSSGYTPSCTYRFKFQGSAYEPLSGKSWRTHSDGMQRLVSASRLIVLGKNPYYRQYHSDFPVIQMENSWTDTAAGYSEEKTYVVQTSNRVIERCMLMTTDPGDLVLDPTCGSGTTAYVAEQWGRRWITIDTSRVAIALARTRLMAGRFPYYMLADSPEGRKKEMEVSGNLSLTPGPSPAGRGESGDIKRGFVYKRVPHVTLKSIANNEEIDAIHADYQAQMEPLREKLNKALKQNWQEWEIPRALTPALSRAAGEGEVLLAQWWTLRRERQKAIDASIARRAETELLYDQPYEDNKRIRVAGPFTVESLSPHRVLPTDDERSNDLPQRGASQSRYNKADFATLIIENLKKAGVQNTNKKERLKFDTLEPYAGTWLHAAGTYTELPSPDRALPVGRGAGGEGARGEGKTRRVVVSIGPEYGTVGPEQVKEAAKEAVQGVGFDLLIVCGFAFDPHVAEEAKRYGKLTVLTAHMNPDLAMGDELLKKTGAGNLFMVFGEPDIEIKRSNDRSNDLPQRGASQSRYCVILKGVDVYDPTTGETRSHNTDDIACWFIDTNYNGESFFVRHAYFTGADQAYEKLKRALRAEIDEAAWSALYQTTSLPFDLPATGKIAVKVINHYGDEVMKVCQV